MSFLNATLIFGVVAAGIPIALHLIARREPKQVVFPAVRFLTQHYQSNRSKLQVRRWWLLALRIAAVVALALALARPMIHQSTSISWLSIGLVGLLGVGLLVMATVALTSGYSRRTAAGLGVTALGILLATLLWAGYTAATGPAPQIETAAPVAIALVLDNSPTINWQSPSADRLARLKETASWLIRQLPPTSPVAIVDRSAKPAVFSLDTAGALSKIDQLEPLQVPQPIATRIEAAVRLVRTSELSNRQVFIVSDLTQSSWDAEIDADVLGEQPAEGDAAEPNIGALAGLLQQDPPVTVNVFDLGEFSGRNRALSLPRIADPTPPRGVAVPLSAVVQLPRSGSAGSSDAEDRPNSGAIDSITVELEMFEEDPTLPVIRNGEIQRPAARQVDRASVRIAPGGSSELTLTVPPLQVGTHHGALRLVGDDALQLDNERYFTLSVLPPSSLLLVSDNTPESRTIGLAVTSPFRIDDPNAEFSVQQSRFSDLPLVRLDDFDAIVMIDPPASALRDPALLDFIADGGGVLVWLGPALGQGEMSIKGFPTLERRWRAPAPGTFLEVLRPSHPVFAALSKLSDGVRWSDFRIHQYWQVQPGPNDLVLSRFAGTDHPSIIERRLGSGRLLIMATPMPALAPATRPWNELFSVGDVWPAFVLTRQLVEQLTGGGAASEFTLVGQPVVISLPESADGADAAETDIAETDAADDPADPVAEQSAPDRWQLFPPGDAAPVPITAAAADPVLDSAGADTRTEVVIRDVTQAGTYWLRGAAVSTGFSANLAEKQTSTARIDPAELDQWFGPQNYTRVTSREEIELAQGESNDSVSLHSPAMLLALVVFLLEQILGNRFYRSKQATSRPSAPAAGAAA